MYNFNDVRKNENKGFSLVELIVVIAIMAVMTSVLAPALLQYALAFAAVLVPLASVNVIVALVIVAVAGIVGIYLYLINALAVLPDFLPMYNLSRLLF